MKLENIDLPAEQIAAFCQKWKIDEFSVFGSVLRDDFRPDSDIDLLVSFEPGVTWGMKLFDMRREIEQLLGRRVDLVTKKALTNPFRRREILTTRRVVYAA